MDILRNVLIFDLYVAFYKARKHKTNKTCVKDFESNLQQNIEDLADSLINKTYKPLPSDRFVIYDPKIREIYAAAFRDRIVHHLYYQYTHTIFEDTFIHDTYSCIKGRGTHFGINRLRHHIESESQNYTKDCYILKIDIRGYFMHINKEILYRIVEETLIKFKDKLTVELDFILYLSREIIFTDPTINCNNISSEYEFAMVPDGKSLDDSPDGSGIPIGNLTSQLFSNVYMNVFDQYVKRELKCRHYGRYVDDGYAVSCDKDYLLSIIPKIDTFLLNELHLELHKGKTKIYRARYGVEFLGAFVKPHRIYPSNESLNRMRFRMDNEYPTMSAPQRYTSFKSRLGTLSHYKSFNIRKELLLTYL